MTRLSIVMVTHNSEHVIEGALRSIYMQQPSAADTIVIDNGSTDKTVELIQRRFPQVTLILNKSNEGACKARNQGIALSTGEWILTLDCDTVLEANFMQRIHEAIRAVSDDVGMIQPKILMEDATTVYSLGIHLDWMRRFFDVGYGRPDNRQQGVREVFGACAAAAVYRRRMLEELKEETGYFDERFFFLVEDVDLAWRAHRKGWEGVAYPRALCFHDGNSSQTNGKLRQYLCLRNRFYAIKKNEGLARYSRKILPVLFYDIPRYCFAAASNPYVHGRILQALHFLRWGHKPGPRHSAASAGSIKGG